MLLKSGDTFIGGITMPSHLNGTAAQRIKIGSYGIGARPIIDGNRTAAACIYARASGNSVSPVWSYVTIDGFECRNTTQYGVIFYQNSGGSFGMPGIVVSNTYIHNTGPSYDDNNYRNQLMFDDENQRADGVQFLSNIVTNCGGHNCVQVQQDTGAPQVIGNTCSHWFHNCIDVKGSIHAMVRGNTVDGTGSSTGSCFYYENPEIPAGDITFTKNICYNAPNGFECEHGANVATTSTCTITNNTADLGTQSAIAVGGDAYCTGHVTVIAQSNILNTTSTFYNGHSCLTPTWDYNNDGGAMGIVGGPRGAHDFLGINPMFINVSGRNYALQTLSPMIGAAMTGANVGAF
jgi:hypothetical protein